MNKEDSKKIIESSFFILHLRLFCSSVKEVL